MHTVTRYLPQMIKMTSLIHSVNYPWQWLCVSKHRTTKIKTGKNSIKPWFSFLIWKELFMISINKKLLVLLEVLQQRMLRHPMVLLFSHQPMAFLDVSQLLLLIDRREIIRISSNPSTWLRSSSNPPSKCLQILLTLR